MGWRAQPAAAGDDAQVELLAPLLAPGGGDGLSAVQREGPRAFPSPGRLWWYARGQLSLRSRCLFTWITPVVSLGSTAESLSLDDALPLPPALTAKVLSNRFGDLWEKQQAAGRASLRRTLQSLFGWEFCTAGLFRLISDTCSLTSPLVLRELILYTKGDADFVPGSTLGGVLLALLMYLVVTTQALALQQFVHGVFMVGAKVNSTLTTAVYKKALKLPRRSLEGSRLGQVLNFQAKDASKVREFIVFFHNLWAAPLMALGCTVLLLNVLGPTALVGVCAVPILIPVETWVAKRSEKFRKAVVKVADKRISLIGEVVDGMKTIKLNSLEGHFQGRVEALRTAELASIRRALVLNACNQAIMRSSPVIVALATFAAYTLAGNALDAETAFTALALFNTISHPFHVMPKAVQLLADARVSVARLQDFLLEAETTRDAVFRPAACGGGARAQAAPPRVVLDNAAFAPDSGAEPCLRFVSLEFPKGLSVLVGPVGSGKSTLLLGIFEQMDGQGPGEVAIECRDRRVALCRDTPWIINASARDNICVGSRSETFSQERYSAAVEACALDMDFAMWLHGEDTIIGEKGVTISGGQKARIALARAMYADCDVTLLDDPLASSDPVVGRHVFDRAVKAMAARGCVVMATHQQQYLRDADKIFVMDSGTLSVAGDYTSLLNSGVDFQAYVEGGGQEDAQDEVEDSFVSSPRPGGVTPVAAAAAAAGKGEEGAGARAGKVAGAGGGGAGLAGRAAAAKGAAIPRAAPRDPSQQRVDEDRIKGGVSASVYTDYFAACGWATVMGAFAVSVCAQMVSVSKEVVLAAWSDSVATRASAYLSVYGAVCLSVVAMNCVRFFVICYVGLRASAVLHQSLLQRVMGAPLRFFQSTASGRISSRFASDCDTLDLVIPTTLASFVDALLTMVTAVAVVVGTSPVFVFFIVPFVLTYHRVQTRYRSTAKELKRLDSATKSPIFSHFQETLDGLPSIQAYRIQASLTRTSYRHVDANARARLSWDATNRWLGIRLDLLGALLVFLAALLAVLGRRASPGVVGLGLSYALTITRTLSFGVRSSTAMENQFNSVERICEFIGLEQEPELADGHHHNGGEGGAGEDEESGRGGCRGEARWQKSSRGGGGGGTVPVPEVWPRDGLELRNVSARYRPDLLPVLSGVSLSIPCGQRVGVCGRTGCGKSTLALALIRVVDCSPGAGGGGTISGDGRDIRSVPLSVLRSRITVIPQDAQLFSGTVRETIDPLGQCVDDARIWEIADMVGIKPLLAGLDCGLDSWVSERGGNWSTGQRQLLCIARAMVNRSRVFVFDEASANVDLNTDATIRWVIESQLGDCAVVVIAHRMQDIVPCDQVVVMDAGRVVEVGPPRALLKDPAGALSALVQELGPEEVRAIRQSLA